MELTKINGNSYYIDNPTNIGVYTYKNKYCMLIDTGINNSAASKVYSMLADLSLKPKYIVNTHNHPDHTGGNRFFYEHCPGCVFYASQDEKLFIENDALFSEMLYGACPVKELTRGNAKSKSIKVDYVLECGTVKINEEKFEIISLPGHSKGHICIGTADKVCYLGDSIFSEHTLSKYPLPFLFDIEKQLDTLETIKELDYDYYVLGHADRVYDSMQIKDLAEKNKNSIEKNINDIKELLFNPLTREELLEQMCIVNDIKLDYRDYYLCSSAIGAFIAYLYNNELLAYEVENGKLYYYVR